MSTLDEHRQAIDVIDAQIIDLLAARKAEVEGVIRYKAEHNMAPLQPARFQAVLDKCRQRATDNKLDPDVVEAIWHTMHQYFLKLEGEALSK